MSRLQAIVWRIFLITYWQADFFGGFGHEHKIHKCGGSKPMIEDEIFTSGALRAFAVQVTEKDRHCVWP